MTGVLINKQGNLDTETYPHRGEMLWRYTGRRPCVDEEFMIHLQAKECQNLLANHQRLGRGKEAFFYRFQKEHGSADTLILDSWLPGQHKNKSVVLGHRVGGTLLCSPRKQTYQVTLSITRDVGSLRSILAQEPSGARCFAPSPDLLRTSFLHRLFSADMSYLPTPCVVFSALWQTSVEYRFKDLLVTLCR